jgi:hypothetical protein
MQVKRQRKDPAPGRAREAGQGSGRASWPVGKGLSPQQAFSDSAAASENLQWQVGRCMPA